MVVGNHMEEFEMEASESYGVVCGCEFELYDASSLACLKHFLDVLGEDGHLVCGRPPAVEAGLFF